AEPLQTHLPTLVQSIYQDILPFLDKPFVFFGHSMGALLSFELARLLRKEHGENGPAPEHLFVSATEAPHQRQKEPRLSELPYDELVPELRRFNGMPKEVLENEELMHLLLPMLRADFTLCDAYEYIPEPPLACPMTVFRGLEDHEVKREELEAWKEQTTGPFSIRMLPGDHFYIHASQALLLRVLSQELRRIADRIS
ncbi:MAG: thioesterase II family protein, partial [Pyrinomonadaceae bacterium]